jgi:hypothetical protein
MSFKGDLVQQVPYSRFAALANGNTFPAPSNTAPYTFTENSNGVYVGTTGDVVVVGIDGVSVTFKNVPQGTILPINIAVATTVPSNTLVLFQ